MTWALPTFDEFLDGFVLNNNSSRKITGNTKGVPPYQLTLEPPSLNFGTAFVSQSSPPLTVKVTNTGFMVLTIIGLRVVGPFTMTNNAPLYLKPGESFEITVVFKPRSTGWQTGGIFIRTHKDVDDTFIELTGEGSIYDLILDGTWILDGTYRLDGFRKFD